MTHSDPKPAASGPKRRLRECVEVWPNCYEGGYDPRCCRFPKSCSCDVYDWERVGEDDLEPAPKAAASDDLFTDDVSAGATALHAARCGCKQRHTGSDEREARAVVAAVAPSIAARATEGCVCQGMTDVQKAWVQKILQRVRADAEEGK